MVTVVTFPGGESGSRQGEGNWAESTRCLLSAQATQARGPRDLSWLPGVAAYPGPALPVRYEIPKVCTGRNLRACTAGVQTAWGVQCEQGSRQHGAAPLQARVLPVVCMSTLGDAGGAVGILGGPRPPAWGRSPRLVLCVPRARG